MAKNLPANAGDTRDKGLIPGSGRPLGEGSGNPTPWTEEPGGLTVHGVAKRQTQLSPPAFHFSTRDRHPYLTGAETGLRGLGQAEEECEPSSSWL